MAYNTTKRQQILEDIEAERDRQDVKWGDIYAPGRIQNYGFWNTVLMEEVGEAAEASLDVMCGSREKLAEARQHYYDEVIQCAAVCVAMLESHEEGLL